MIIELVFQCHVNASINVKVLVDAFNQEKALRDCEILRRWFICALLINHCNWLIDCVNAVPFLLKGEARGGSEGRELGTVCLSFSLFRSSEADLAEERLLVLQKVPSEGS